VEAALREWTREQARLHPELLRLGYFGSYARGDWGVGSDLDLFALVDVRPELT
jgi:predicted nucleotidyltransferase